MVDLLPVESAVRFEDEFINDVLVSEVCVVSLCEALENTANGGKNPSLELDKLYVAAVLQPQLRRESVAPALP